MVRLYALERVEKQRVRFTAGFVAVFACFALCSMLFVKLASEVREQETIEVDEAVLEGIHSMSNYFLNTLMPVATDIGGAVGVIAISMIMVALFIYKNEQRRALMLTVSVAGAAGINLILKAVFERTRPDLWDKLINEPGFSFPSGHAMASAALGLAVVVVLWDSRWRWWALAAATAYVLFVGFSRLYLGVHYPTDIIAGWFVSGAWVMAVTLMLRSQLGNYVLRKLA